MMKTYDELLQVPELKEKVNKAIDALDESKSVIINSKTGTGKTTLLRLIAYALVKNDTGRGIAFDKKTTKLEPLAAELAEASLLDISEDYNDHFDEAYYTVENDGILFIDDVSSPELMNTVVNIIRAGQQVVFVVHCEEEEDLEKRVLQLTEHTGLTNYLMMHKTVGIHLKK